MTSMRGVFRERRWSIACAITPAATRVFPSPTSSAIRKRRVLSSALYSLSNAYSAVRPLKVLQAAENALRIHFRLLNSHVNLSLAVQSASHTASNSDPISSVPASVLRRSSIRECTSSSLCGLLPSVSSIRSSRPGSAAPHAAPAFSFSEHAAQVGEGHLLVGRQKQP